MRRKIDILYHKDDYGAYHTKNEKLDWKNESEVGIFYNKLEKESKKILTKAENKKYYNKIIDDILNYIE